MPTPTPTPEPRRSRSPTGEPPSPRRATFRLLAAVAATVAAAAALTGCGDTIQAQPLRESDFARAANETGFPVYWLGRSFEGMPVSTLDRDPAGAYLIDYGNCVTGGQDTCVAPLLIVTSPDNSFLPGGSRHRVRVAIRGRQAAVAEGGRTIELATGGVVVSIFARSPGLARAAADLMAPINQPGPPGAALPPPQPDTGFDQVPIGEPLNADQPGRGNALSRATSSRSLGSSTLGGAAGH